MGNKAVRLDINGNTLTIDDIEYKITPGLVALIHPRPTQFNSSDYKAYKSLVAQTKVRLFPNRTGTARPHTTWKWKHMLKKMGIPGERIVEVESEDTDDTDTASIGESSDISSPGILPSDSGILSPGSSIPSPVHTRSYGKAK